MKQRLSPLGQYIIYSSAVLFLFYCCILVKLYVAQQECIMCVSLIYRVLLIHLINEIWPDGADNYH